MWWVWTGKQWLISVICIQLQVWINLKWKRRVLNLWLMSHGKVIMWSKIEFTNKFAEIAVLLFCEINHNTPWFCLVLGIFITLWKKWFEVFCKNSQQLNRVNYFCKKLHLRCFTVVSIQLRLSSLNTSPFLLLLRPLWINKLQKQSFTDDS